MRVWQMAYNLQLNVFLNEFFSGRQFIYCYCEVREAGACFASQEGESGDLQCYIAFMYWAQTLVQRHTSEEQRIGSATIPGAIGVKYPTQGSNSDITLLVSDFEPATFWS